MACYIGLYAGNLQALGSSSITGGGVLEINVNGLKMCAEQRGLTEESN